MKTGLQLISKERNRQIQDERWSAEHDAQHTSNELAKAAACYALDNDEVFVLKAENNKTPIMFDPWPWFGVWDKRKKHPRIKKLQIAGALIAAELDRLLKIDQEIVK